jgi:hypothetical protein
LLAAAPEQQPPMARNRDSSSSVRTHGRFHSRRLPRTAQAALGRSRDRPTPSTAPNPSRGVRCNETLERENRKLEQRVRQHHPRARRDESQRKRKGSASPAGQISASASSPSATDSTAETTQNSGSTQSGGRMTTGIDRLREERCATTSAGGRSRYDR